MRGSAVSRRDLTVRFMSSRMAMRERSCGWCRGSPMDLTGRLRVSWNCHAYSTPGVIHDSHASDAGGPRRIAVPFLNSIAGATRTLVGTHVGLARRAARQRTPHERAVAELFGGSRL